MAEWGGVGWVNGKVGNIGSNILDSMNRTPTPKAGFPVAVGAGAMAFGRQSLSGLGAAAVATGVSNMFSDINGTKMSNLALGFGALLAAQPYATFSRLSKLFGDSKDGGSSSSSNSGVNTGTGAGNLPAPVAANSIVSIMQTQTEVFTIYMSALVESIGMLSKAIISTRSQASSKTLPVEVSKFLDYLKMHELNSYQNIMTALQRPISVRSDVSIPSGAVIVTNTINSPENDNLAKYVGSINDLASSVRDIASRPVQVENTLQNNLKVDSYLQVKEPLAIKFDEILSASMLKANEKSIERSDSIIKANEKSIEKADLQIESLNYARTATAIKDIDGNTLVSAPPREAVLMKDIALARTYADENSLDFDDINFMGGFDLSKLLEIFGLPTPSEITKEYFNL